MPKVRLIKVAPVTDRVLDRILLNRAQEERADGMVPGEFLAGFTYDVDFRTVADILRCDVGDVAEYEWRIEID